MFIPDPIFSIPDPIFSIPDPRSRVDKIPDPGSTSKSLSVLSQKTGLGFSLPDPGFGFFFPPGL
jgi:hypothetical protein